jgi:O-antigen ligase
MKNIASSLTKFINSRLYVTILFFVISIFWLLGKFIIISNPYFNFESLSYITLSLFSIISLFYAKDGFPFIPLIIFALLVPNNGSMNFSTVPITLVICSIIYVVSIVAYIIKNKINLIKGKLKWSMLVVTILLLSVSFRLPKDAPSFLYLFLLILPAYLFIYLFFSSSIKGDKRVILAETFMYAGLIIFIQSFTYFLSTPLDTIINNIIKGDSYSISFSHGNIGAIVLNITIGLTFGLILLKPNNIFYQLSLIPQVFALILTASRAGILIFMLMLVAYLVLLFIYKPSIKYFIIRIGIIIAGGLIVLFAFNDIIEPLLTFFIKSLRGNDPLTGRIDLYKEALAYFKSNPIFGVGVLGVIDVFTKTIDGVVIKSYAFRSFHNMPLQVLACSGIVGAIAVIYNYFDIFKLLLTKVDKFKLCVLVVIVGATIHSLVDNVYMMVDYTILAYSIFGVLEAYDSTKITYN